MYTNLSVSLYFGLSILVTTPTICYHWLYYLGASHLCPNMDFPSRPPTPTILDTSNKKWRPPLFPISMMKKWWLTFARKSVLCFQNSVNNSIIQYESADRGASGVIFNNPLRAINTFIIWLAPWADKMNQILRCDYLPERAGWSYLASSRLRAVSRKKNFPEAGNLVPRAFPWDKNGWREKALASASHMITKTPRNCGCNISGSRCSNTRCYPVVVVA